MTVSEYDVSAAPLIEYVRARGGIVHRRLVMDGIRFTAEACNLDASMENVISNTEAEGASRRCRRCNPAVR